MKVSSIAVIVLVLLSAGLATGVITVVSRNRELTAQLEQAQVAPSQATPPVDAGWLRQLLEEQELANAELRNELAQLQREATNNTPARAGAARASGSDQARNLRSDSGTAWLDRLKQEDPERYKQIVQQREQRRKAADQWFQDTIDQLDQRAQSAPTQTEAELATQIADTLAKLNELRQQWRALRSLPEDSLTQDLAVQMRQTESQLRDLSKQDRELQLQKYALSLGLTDESGVQDFVNGVAGIYSNTNYRAIVGGGGFGGGGRGGPPQDTGGRGGSPSGTGNTPPSPNP